MTTQQPRLLPGVHSTCGRCRAPIAWAMTDQNKRMPLDVYVDETGTGNVAVMQDHTRRLRARVLKAGEQPYGYERRAVPHFATCNTEPWPSDLPTGVSSISDAPSRRGRQ